MLKQTKFNLAEMQRHLAHFFPTDSPRSVFTSYQQFNVQIPILNSAGLATKMAQLLATEKLTSCLFGMTSGTTGKPKLIANALWRHGNKEKYARYLKQQIQDNILNSNDVVVNLFTAGGLALLYDGCNRLLESIGCSVLPVGRLDIVSESSQRQIVTLLSELKVNVLFGTPASIVQLLKLSKTMHCELHIDKIIFTGEPFSKAKRQYVYLFWPKTKIYGLYGHSETGFIGFNTPNCLENTYHLWDEWFFIEIGAGDEIIVTSLADTLMPIIRYRVGDSGRLLEQFCPCGLQQPLLLLQDRVDDQFNFAGNLIARSVIAASLRMSIGEDTYFQIQLDTDVGDGCDVLKLVLDKTSEEVMLLTPVLMEKLTDIAEVNEGISKLSGKIALSARDELMCSERQKIPYIVDKRGR